MKVIILCGGKGTRLREETEFKPKPMVGIFNGDAVVCGETVVGFEEPPDGLNGWGHEISPDADGVEKRPKRDCGVGVFLPGRTGVFTFAACFASVTGLR